MLLQDRTITRWWALTPHRAAAWTLMPFL